MQKIEKKSVSGNLLIFDNFSEDELVTIKSGYSVSDFVAKFVASKIKTEGIDPESFLNPKVKNLMPDPFSMKDMSKGCDVFASHFTSAKKIAVFGDYDVDGACCAALLKLFCSKAGFNMQNFLVYIPHRMKEGYGPNKDAFLKLKEQGVDLVVTVDCGIVAFDVIRFAKEIGLSVIILDHHKSGAELPVADAVINPNRFDETGLGYLCGAGVVFMFCVGLYLRMFPDNVELKNFLFERLDIVALATICDVVPLKGLNRAFVRQGLKSISKKLNCGIVALMEECALDVERVCARDIGFKIGPLINAGGRLGFSMYGAELLSCQCPEVAREIASKLNILNKERIEVEKQTSLSAIREVNERINASEGNVALIFVYDEVWHEGIIGIVASRLQERYKKPSIVACKIKDEDGLDYIKASCRSSGVDIGKIVLEMVEEGVLCKGGGHFAAAGFSAKLECLDDVRSILESKFLKAQEGKFYDPEIKIDYVIMPTSIDSAFFEDLLCLEPFGQCNNKPNFLLSGVRLFSSQSFGLHIKMSLRHSGVFLNAISFNAVGTLLGDFLLKNSGKVIDVVCNIDADYWAGRLKPNIVVLDIVEQDSYF